MFAILLSDRRGRGRLAGLRADQQCAGDLGLVGLTQFVPTALLVFVAGHAADRFDRRRVAQMSQFAAAATAAFLAWGSFSGWIDVPAKFSPRCGVRHDRSVRKSGRRGDAAAGGAGTACCNGRRRFRASPFRSRPSSARRSAASPMRSAGVPYGAMAVSGWLPPRQRRRPAQRPQPSQASRRRSPACSPASDLCATIRHLRHHLARSVRGVVRRRHRADADLCARHPAHRAMGLGRFARRAGGRRHGDGEPRSPRTSDHRSASACACSRPSLFSAWRRRVRAVALVVAFGPGAGRARSRRHDQRGDPVSLVQLRTPDAMRGRVGAVNYLFINASPSLAI